MVIEEDTVWATTLPSGMPAQRVELIALTKALEMAEGKRLHLYMNNCYDFTMAHIHGTIYQEYGLLTNEAKTTKKQTEDFRPASRIMAANQIGNYPLSWPLKN